MTNRWGLTNEGLKALGQSLEHFGLLQRLVLRFAM